MKIRIWRCTTAVIACMMLTGLAGRGEWNGPQAAAESSRSSAVGLSPPGSTTEWHYTLTARVRPLLLWISRHGVGGARIAWTEEEDGSRAAELLIGSDPARAPMRVNRWGYVGERVAGPTAEVLGVMTASDEESVGQAKESLDRPGAHAFKAIRGWVSDGVAHSTVIHLRLADDLTYKDAAVLLRKLPQAGPVTRRTNVPPGVMPGFLFAVKSLIHETVDGYNRSGRISGLPSQRVYIYNSSIYELAQESSEFLAETVVGGRSYRAAIESRFETRNMATGQTSRFIVTCGTQPPIEETPIRIVYRPRWWFEAELLLQQDTAVLEAAGDAKPWNPFSR